MFRAVGIILVLWYLSHQFTASFAALDEALTASLKTIEVAAETSRTQLEVR